MKRTARCVWRWGLSGRPFCARWMPSSSSPAPCRRLARGTTLVRRCHRRPSRSSPDAWGRPRGRVATCAREADAWRGTRLLSMLRGHLGRVGSKNAGEQGECGSCSLWLDGELVCACLVLAAQAGGRDVRTVESLAPGDRLHPVQDAFVEAGAVQCGFCTPGLIVAAADLLQRDPTPGDETIREALAGNLCRCTGYQKIIDAVKIAAERMRT